MCKRFLQSLCQVFAFTFFVFRNSVEKFCVSWALPLVECVAVWALKLPVPHTDVLKTHESQSFSTELLEFKGIVRKYMAQTLQRKRLHFYQKSVILNLVPYNWRKLYERSSYRVRELTGSVDLYELPTAWATVYPVARAVFLILLQKRLEEP